jgi:hypothetical protein
MFFDPPDEEIGIDELQYDEDGRPRLPSSAVSPFNDQAKVTFSDFLSWSRRPVFQQRDRLPLPYAMAIAFHYGAFEHARLAHFCKVGLLDMSAPMPPAADLRSFTANELGQLTAALSEQSEQDLERIRRHPISRDAALFPVLAAAILLERAATLFRHGEWKYLIVDPRRDISLLLGDSSLVVLSQEGEANIRERLLRRYRLDVVMSPESPAFSLANDSPNGPPAHPFTFQDAAGHKMVFYAQATTKEEAQVEWEEFNAAFVQRLV